MDNFNTETKEDNVIVDFWAPWCAPCRMLGPNFEALSKEMKDIKFAKVNIDENNELADMLNVKNIPCMVLFKDGEEVNRILGAFPKDSLKKRIEEGFN